MANEENGVLCYNKGCGKRFIPEENAPESCIHHPGGPIFHDAYKGWSCCKKRTTDFTEFLNIPGCSKGLHNPEKPPDVLKQTPVKSSDTVGAPDDVITVQTQERKPLQPIERPSGDEPLIRLPITIGASLKSALAKLNLNKTTEADGDNTDSTQIKIGTECTNKGCNVEYQGESHEHGKCTHHPGTAIFHEGMKYWSCCERKTSDFNNFLNQEGCTTIDDHIWTLSEDAAKKLVACRHDWHQTGSFAVLSVFCKNSDPEKTLVEANQVNLKICITFDGGKSQFHRDISLEGPIDPQASKVNMLGTKVEVKLKKNGEPYGWKRFELTPETRPDDDGDETPDSD